MHADGHSPPTSDVHSFALMVTPWPFDTLVGFLCCVSCLQNQVKDETKDKTSWWTGAGHLHGWLAPLWQCRAVTALTGMTWGLLLCSQMPGLVPLPGRQAGAVMLTTCQAHSD